MRVFVIFLIIFFNYFLLSANPTQNPPEGNPDLPINTSSEGQVKSGALSVNGFFNLGNSKVDGFLEVGNNPPNNGALRVDGDIRFTGELYQNGTLIDFNNLGTGGGSTTPWNTVGSSIFYNTGNVGIGTNAPAFKLEVVGNGYFTGPLRVGAYTFPNTDGAAGQVLKTDGSGNLTWQNDNDSGTSGGGTGGVTKLDDLSDAVSDNLNNNLIVGNSSFDDPKDSDYNTVFGLNSYSTPSPFLTSGSLTGKYNSAFGYGSLENNRLGHNNSAFGYLSMNKLEIGYYNSAFGVGALKNNISSSYNSAFGYGSLGRSVGTANSAFGYGSLISNYNGNYNSAFGTNSLENNINGDSNSAFGFSSMLSNRSGGGNVAVGYASLERNTDGNFNVAIGYRSLDNTVSGSNNIAIGYEAGENNSPLFLYGGISNKVVIGNNDIDGAYIKVPWTTTSDARDKADIEDSVYGLDFVNKLRPVTFVWDDRSKYKKVGKKKDGSLKGDKKMLGFLAQDILRIEKEYGSNLNNFLIVDDSDENNLKMKNTALIPVLVKAIQEQQEEIDKLKKEVELLKNK